MKYIVYVLVLGMVVGGTQLHAGFTSDQILSGCAFTQTCGSVPNSTTTANSAASTVMPGPATAPPAITANAAAVLNGSVAATNGTPPKITLNSSSTQIYQNPTGLQLGNYTFVYTVRAPISNAVYINDECALFPALNKHVYKIETQHTGVLQRYCMVSAVSKTTFVSEYGWLVPAGKSAQFAMHVIVQPNTGGGVYRVYALAIPWKKKTTPTLVGGYTLAPVDWKSQYISL